MGMRRTHVLGVSLAALVMMAMACDSGGSSSTSDGPISKRDGSVPADADVKVPDIPAPCHEGVVVVGVAGQGSAVSGDTTKAKQIAVGDTCWTNSATEVVAYVVPGTGPVGVQAIISTDSQGDFFPAFQVGTQCMASTPSPDVCADNYVNPNVQDSARRSTAGTVAEGGDILYFVVTGVTGNAGPWKMQIEPKGVHAPVITSATGTYDGLLGKVQVQGADADANAYAVRVLVRDSKGQVIETEGYPPPAHGYRFSLEDPTTVVDKDAFTLDLTFYIGGGLDAKTLEVRLIDLTRLESEPVLINL